MPHFGIDQLMETRLKGIPDPGMWLDLGGSEIAILPAHFPHSPGNFHVYDPQSRILYSGDLGASLGADGYKVLDFDAHVRFMAGFHRRYMASSVALWAGWRWCASWMSRSLPRSTARTRRAADGVSLPGLVRGTVLWS